MTKKKAKVIADWDQHREEFVQSVLRDASLRWPAKDLAKRAARKTHARNPTSNRMCWHSACNVCGALYPESQLVADHREPVVPVDRDYSKRAYDSTDLGELIVRMFPEPSGYQMLCTACHWTKTQVENIKRNEYRKVREIAREIVEEEFVTVEEELE